MQFSLFGAEAGELALADLDGVLLGGGHWVDTPTGARLSVVVADRWRVAALVDAFLALDVAEAPDPGPPVAIPPAAGTPPAADDAREHAPAPLLVARTRATTALRPVETRWRRGATTVPPDDLVLTAGGLRLWAITAGVADDVGFVLRTPQPADAAGEGGRAHRIAGALLARTGIAAVELAQRGTGARGGGGWRITSARRLRRLAELLGPPPPGAERGWPTVAAGVPGRTLDRHPDPQGARRAGSG